MSYFITCVKCQSCLYLITKKFTLWLKYINKSMYNYGRWDVSSLFITNDVKLSIYKEIQKNIFLKIHFNTQKSISGGKVKQQQHTQYNSISEVWGE